MAANTHGDRLDRLEQVVQILAEDQVSLQNLIAELATETRKGFDRVAAQFEETDKRMRETDDRIAERFRQTDERGRQLDERVDKLVVAIGELISRQDTRTN